MLEKSRMNPVGHNSVTPQTALPQHLASPPLAACCARLLHLPVLRAPLLDPTAYDDISLREEIDRLADSKTPIDDAGLVRLLAKYFHAYVHGSHNERLALDAIGLLFDQFHNRRRGADSLEDKRDLRAFLLHHGFALCMLADLPKSAHILRQILTTPLSPRASSPFLGLDIGTGTGVLMLAMHIAARRAGFAKPLIIGVERDQTVQERTDALVRALGVGRAILGDAKRPETYAALPGGPVSFVCNETLPSLGRRMWREDFSPISAALFAALSQRLAAAAFFPAALWVGDGQEITVRLAPENAFSPDTRPPVRLLKALAIEMDGGPLPLDRIGLDFARYVQPPWQQRLSRRW